MLRPAAIGLLAALLPVGACGHSGLSGRQETFAAFLRSLPVCPSDLTAWSTRVFAGHVELPGSRVVMSGHLSVVAFGPPCPNERWGSGGHCGISWTLWGSDAHPRAFEDMISGDFVMLSGSALPPLRDQRDVEAAAALGDVAVTVEGIAPDQVCDPNDDGLLIGGRAPCTVAFSHFAMTAERVCR